MCVCVYIQVVFGAVNALEASECDGFCFVFFLILQHAISCLVHRRHHGTENEEEMGLVYKSLERVEAEFILPL